MKAALFHFSLIAELKTISLCCQITRDGGFFKPRK
jgi:hypothetical protein